MALTPFDGIPTVEIGCTYDPSLYVNLIVTPSNFGEVWRSGSKIPTRMNLVPIAKFKAIVISKKDLDMEPQIEVHKDVEIVEALDFNCSSFHELESSKIMGSDWSPATNIMDDFNPSIPPINPPPANTKPTSSITILNKLVKDLHDDVQRQDDLLKWIYG